MKTASAFLLLTAAAIGATVTLEWNANPEPDLTDYRLWRGIECVSTVTATTATVTVPDDEPSTFTVTARNADGESPHSESVSIPAPNATRLIIQVSTDLNTWTNVATSYDSKKPRAFYRLKMEVQP